MGLNFRMFFAAIALAMLAAVVLAEPAADHLGSRSVVLLLRNGELVSGEVTPAGDRYDVNVHGGQIRIKKSDVEFVGQSVLECYGRRKALVEPGKIQDYLELTEWCLRNRLYNEAAHALAEAVEIDHTHPRIALLERRLKFAIAQPQTTTASAVTPQGASASDLDRMTRGLPAGTVEMFTNSIQPMLMNHCSAAACHGPQSTNSLRLLRMPAGRSPSRRATQRNLYAVMALVNRQRPEESPLLTAPSKPHGLAKAAIFSTREAGQYKQLARWVQRVAGEGTHRSETADKDAPDTQTPRTSRREEKDTTTDAPQSGKGVEFSDPFDSQEFNQKYADPESSE